MAQRKSQESNKQGGGDSTSLSPSEKKQLSGIMKKLQAIDQQTGEVKGVVDATHGAIMDIRHDMERIQFSVEAIDHGFSTYQWEWINRIFSFLGHPEMRDRALAEGNIVPVGKTGLHFMHSNLELEGWMELRDLPNPFHVDGNCSLIGCENLTSLPPDIQVLGTIYLKGCRKTVIEQARQLVFSKKIGKLDTTDAPYVDPGE